MSSFKPNQQAIWGPREVPVTILAGPFNQERPLRSQWYAIQDGTHETWAYADNLSPLPPKVGDRGVIRSYSRPRVIREINDEYVVTEIVDESWRGAERFDAFRRETFDRQWESLP